MDGLSHFTLPTLKGKKKRKQTNKQKKQTISELPGSIFGFLCSGCFRQIFVHLICVSDWKASNYLLGWYQARLRTLKNWTPLTKSLLSAYT